MLAAVAAGRAVKARLGQKDFRKGQNLIRRTGLVNLRWLRFIALGQATIAALETPNRSDARERGTDSTKNKKRPRC